MGRHRIPGAAGGADRRRHAAAAVAGGSARPRRRAAGLAIIERDGHFHIHGRVVVKGRSRRVRRSTGLRATPAERDMAEEIRRQIEAEIRDELVWGRHPSVPLAVAAAAYLKRPRRRPLNAGDVDRLAELDRVFGRRLLSAIGDGEWNQWIDRRQGGNQPVTRERYIDLVLGFLAWCKARPRHWLTELPAIQRDPTARQRPRRRGRRVGDLSPELVGRLLRHAAPHLKGPLAVMWSTGARVSSLLYGVRLADYLAAPGREQITFRMTKNGDDVVAALHPWAAAVMADYLAWRGRLHEREAPLFLTDRRRALPAEAARRRPAEDRLAPHDRPCRPRIARRRIARGGGAAPSGPARRGARPLAQIARRPRAAGAADAALVPPPHRDRAGA